MTPIPGRGTVEKGFNAWRISTAIGLHFKRSGGVGYDAFKYQFRVKSCSATSFNKRTDRYFYEKCVKTYQSLEEICDFFLSNILRGNIWIGSMNDDTYRDWLANIQSFSYRFSAEVKVLRMSYEKLNMDFNQSLQVSEEYPYSLIIDMLLSNDISIETVTAIDTFVGFMTRVRKKVEVDPLGLFADTSNRILNYKDFLSQRINISKLKLVALDTITKV